MLPISIFVGKRKETTSRLCLTRRGHFVSVSSSSRNTPWETRSESAEIALGRAPFDESQGNEAAGKRTEGIKRDAEKVDTAEGGESY